MNILLEPQINQISRRSFLKLAGSSLLALFWLPLGGGRLAPLKHLSDAQEVSTLGRILNAKTTRRKAPSFNADIIELYHKDEVIPITAITLGEDPTDYNRIWYQVGDGQGFVYSGGVQPVEVRHNPAAASISEKGQLAEVTVPFTEARWTCKGPSSIPYRFYYGTTHWVCAVEQDADGKTWYQVHDDKKGYSYYVDATHLHLLPESEISPLSPQVPPEEKHLEVRLKEQVVIAYEGESPVFMTRTATGANFRDGDYRTQPGTYATNRKRPSRHMATGEPGIGSGFDLPGVPWVSYLTKSGVSFHGTFWHNDFGAPRSHGCINLSISASRWIYRWTLPAVPTGEELVEQEDGTRVTIL